MIRSSRTESTQKGVHGAEAGAGGIRRQSDIHKGDFGGDVLLGLEKIAQGGQTRIGHLDGSEAMGTLGGEVRPLGGLDQRIEDGGFARGTGADKI